jgi:hypothetical protein
MKKIVLIAILLVGQSVLANSNPQMRTCRMNLGQFWTLNIEVPKMDNIGFCRYGIEMIDSISFMNYAFNNSVSKSLDAFLDTEDMAHDSCSDAGADLITGKDSYNSDTELCVFSDYSFIKKSTLIKGWNHPHNIDLTSALIDM